MGYSINLHPTKTLLMAALSALGVFESKAIAVNVILIKAMALLN